MRQIFDFEKTTALGGAIFLLPFAAMLIVVVKAGKMAVDSVTPVTIPRQSRGLYFCEPLKAAGRGR